MITPVSREDLRPASPSPQHSVVYQMQGASGEAARTVAVDASPPELEQFLEDGYLVRENLLSRPMLLTLREALDTVSEHEATRDNPGSPETGQFLRHLFFKHASFAPLLTYPPAVSVGRALLGPALEARLSARITSPVRAGQQVPWHYHVHHVPSPAPLLATFPHRLDVLIYLDDVTDANGALGVVPGSHRQTGALPRIETLTGDRADEISVCVRAGGGVFVHNALLHRGRPSLMAGGLRRMLALTLSPVSLKSLDDGPLPVDDHLIQRLLIEGGADVHELLGRRHYETA